MHKLKREKPWQTTCTLHTAQWAGWQGMAWSSKSLCGRSKVLQLVICNHLTSPQLQNWRLPPPPPADGRILPQDMKGGHQWLLQHLRD